jgi:uncharacterized protein (UPF0332 family)
MSKPLTIYLAKADESLLGAQSEVDQGRYNNAANRCYFTCFQAAIAALQQANIAPPGGQEDWGHAFVQAAFVGQSINRRKLYAPGLRQVLARNLTLRHKADYARDLVTQRQAERAVQRTLEFLAAIREKVDGHEA